MHFFSYVHSLEVEFDDFKLWLMKKAEDRVSAPSATETDRSEFKYLKDYLARIDDLLAKLGKSEASSVARSHAGRLLKVACLDDDEVWTERFESLNLNQHRIRVDHFTNVQGLEDHLKRSSYDGILLDVVLGGGTSGIDLIERIKSLAKCPIVLFTLYPSASVIKRGIHEGVSGVISKLSPMNELADEIRTYFEDPISGFDKDEMRQFTEVIKQLAPLLDETRKSQILKKSTELSEAEVTKRKGLLQDIIDICKSAGGGVAAQGIIGLIKTIFGL